MMKFVSINMRGFSGDNKIRSDAQKPIFTDEFLDMNHNSVSVSVSLDM